MNIFNHVIACLLCAACLSCEKSGIEIRETILRDRVVVADSVVLKKALYVAFSLPTNAEVKWPLQIMGSLVHADREISRARTTLIREGRGNLVFDLPCEMPDAPLVIRIETVGNNGTVVSRGRRTLRKPDLRKYAGQPDATPDPMYREVLPLRQKPLLEPTAGDRAAGYLVFSRSPLEYVYSQSAPRQAELIHAVSLRTVRNSHATTSIGVYALRDLGRIRISVTDLTGSSGKIPKKAISINRLEEVEDTQGLPAGQFRKLPTLIGRTDSAQVRKEDICRFFITIKIDHRVQPGAYSGVITLTPEYGGKRTLPLTAAVEPIKLEEVPNKDYFMLMTYEFSELALPGDTRKKEALHHAAVNILKDYREHGMTTIAVHSPFVLLTHEDGSPVLDDIYAALIAARDLGFTRPIIWYMGHLIQTAKPKHPGNITAFDEKRQQERLASLVQTVAGFAKKNHCPPVIFLPIDEPGDAGQDYGTRRQEATRALLKVVKDAGGKTMVTSEEYPRFKPVDYVCSAKVKQEDLQQAHRDGSVYWSYDNDVTTKCDNPAYTRYIYGYYTWKHNIDGMSSWTFQNTQNASGLPTKADAAGTDLYLAYPDPDGPLATLKWEAIREGINDHKLVYQLEKRISALRANHINVSRYERALAAIREKLGQPGCHAEEQTEWGPAFFEKTRNELITLIKDADDRAGRKSIQ